MYFLEQSGHVNWYIPDLLYLSVEGVVGMDGISYSDRGVVEYLCDEPCFSANTCETGPFSVRL
jgi:hypothetical protein